MNPTTIDFIEKMLNANATKVDLADAVVDANRGEVVQAGKKLGSVPISFIIKRLRYGQI